MTRPTALGSHQTHLSIQSRWPCSPGSGTTGRRSTGSRPRVRPHLHRPLRSRTEARRPVWTWTSPLAVTLNRRPPRSGLSGWVIWNYVCGPAPQPMRCYPCGPNRVRRRSLRDSAVNPTQENQPERPALPGLLPLHRRGEARYSARPMDGSQASPLSTTPFRQHRPNRWNPRRPRRATLLIRPRRRVRRPGRPRGRRTPCNWSWQTWRHR